MGDNQELALQTRGVTALVNVQREELDTQITTAKAYPRDVECCIRDMKAYVEALGPESAEDLYYTLPPRKGSDEVIEGPSVRLAEICASTWGNLRAQTRIVGESDHNVIAEAVVWDLEKNYAITMQKPRPIYGKYGRYSDDMVAKTALAAQSIALRDAVYKILPRPVIDSLVTRAKQLTAQSDQISKKRESLVAHFAAMGVDRDKLFRHLGVASNEEITPAQIVTMRGVATAIKDGQTTIDEVFNPPAPSAGATADSVGKAEARLIHEITQEAEALKLDAVRLREEVKKAHGGQNLDAMNPMQLTIVLRWIRERRPEDFSASAKTEPKAKNSKVAEGNLI